MEVTLGVGDHNRRGGAGRSGQRATRGREETIREGGGKASGFGVLRSVGDCWNLSVTARVWEGLGLVKGAVSGGVGGGGVRGGGGSRWRPTELCVGGRLVASGPAGVAGARPCWHHAADSRTLDEIDNLGGWLP